MAALLETNEGSITNVRIALGGVAHKPWRALAAESVLRGSAASDSAFRNAAETELAEAEGLAHNSFKIAQILNSLG